ncbi:Kynurenine formamidase [anaerobic digester metagenome]
MRLVGIDALSVQPYGDEEPRVHAILFEGRAVVLEGLALDGVETGWWELLCLPLPLTGADASPVRAILRRPAEEKRT